MMAQSTINNYDDQPVSERKSTPTSAGDSLLVRENKMRACQCTGVHKINNKRTSTETYFIHILNNTNTCPWNICALHSLPLGKSSLGESGLLVPGASESSRLITSARLACRSTSDWAAVVVVFGLRFTFSMHDDGGGVDMGVGVIHGLVGVHEPV